MGNRGSVAPAPATVGQHTAPHAVDYAEYKPVQLRAAATCGLRVAATLVTNDPAAARGRASAPWTSWCLRPVDWTLLEVNANSQWAWIEDETGLPNRGSARRRARRKDDGPCRANQGLG